jgi:hypothetical protein
VKEYTAQFVPDGEPLLLVGAGSASCAMYLVASFGIRVTTNPDTEQPKWRNASAPAKNTDMGIVVVGRLADKPIFATSVSSK